MSGAREPYRLVRVAPELIDQWGTRTENGQRITAAWGEPVASVGTEPGLTFDIYEPIFTVSGDTEAERIAEAAEKALHSAAERVRALPVASAQDWKALNWVRESAVLAILQVASE
jgi:hypothetical protein